MESKQSLLIYSDGYIFGGTEKLISILIRNPIIQEQYNITYVYRKHKLYQNGLNKEYNKEEMRNILFPVKILANNTLSYKIDLLHMPLLIKYGLKLPFYIIEALGVYFIFNLLSHFITLKKIKPDVIHIMNGGYPGARSCNAMVVVAKILGVKKVIYQVNNLALKPFGVTHKFYDPFINGNVSCFITASQQAKEKLVKVRKFDPLKIRQVPNTILEDESLRSRKEILEELSLSSTDYVLCSVGFLSKRKGHYYLLMALNQIKQSQPGIFERLRLLIVGDGEEERFLKQYVIKNDLEDHVYFLGYQSQSTDYINACDVFVFPSIAGEDMPLVILYAMNKGKTILATDFGGIREEIENGISGILISPDTDTLSSELTKNIVQLFNNRSNAFGSNAEKRYNEVFSNSVYGRSLVNIYNRAC